MLTSEQGQKALESAKTKQALTKFSERIETLPDNLRLMLYGFRRRNAQNEKYKHNEWQKAEAAHNTAIKVFHALPDAERQIDRRRSASARHRTDEETLLSHLY